MNYEKLLFTTKQFEATFFFSITDWGIILRVCKNTPFVNYHYSIDIQILCVNLWICLIRRNKNNKI